MDGILELIEMNAVSMSTITRFIINFCLAFRHPVLLIIISSIFFGGGGGVGGGGE